MQTYAQMKNSGVAWLGKIPAKWSIGRIKNVAQLKTGGTPKGNKGINTEGDGYSWFTPSDLTSDLAPSTPLRSITQVVVEEDKIQLFPKHSTLFVCIGNVGKVGITANSSYSNQQITAVIPNEKIAPRFLTYYLCSASESLQKSANITMLAIINNRFLSTTPVLLPDYKTQERIADFLDTETALIDDLIAKQQHLLELLEEKRRATITHAVTGSAYKKVALKMILQIPLTDGPHETPTLVDDGVPFVSAEACSSGKVNFDKVRGYITREEHERFSKKTLPQKNDIFIIKSGATTGTVALVDTDREFNIWSPLALVRVNESYAYYKFVYYALTSREFLHQIETNWSYGTQQNIGMGILKDLKLSLPDVNTQKKIADRLESELIKIEELGQKIQAQITLLRERRTSLISHAVTGKVKI